MNMPTSEGSRTNPEPTEVGVLAEGRKADRDTTAPRLKALFAEGHKAGATENPEAGCVPWYHFPDGPKGPWSS